MERRSIELRWTNGTTSQTTVEIERCTGSNCTNFVQVTSITGTATTFTDGSLARRTTYSYRVRGVNEFGRSPYQTRRVHKRLASEQKRATRKSLRTAKAEWAAGTKIVERCKRYGVCLVRAMQVEHSKDLRCLSVADPTAAAPARAYSNGASASRCCRRS